MPFLLLAGMGFSAFFAGVATLAGMAMLLMVPFAGTYTVDDQPVSRGEFLRQMWPMFIAFPVVVSAIWAVAYGLWKERPWTREAIMAYWLCGAGTLVVVQIATPTSSSDFLGGLLGVAGCAGIAGWYLYGTEGVRAYYRAIERRRAGGATDGA